MAKQEKEEWKPVVGYEGLYQVSSLGRVRSTARDIMSQQCYVRSIKAKIMSQDIKKRTGKKSVVLLKNGGRVHKDVGTLVAMAFIVNEHNYLEVAYKDYDVLNNRVSNLEWRNPPLTLTGKPMAVCKTCKAYFDKELTTYHMKLCPSCFKDYKKRANYGEDIQDFGAKESPRTLEITDTMRKEASDASWMGSASIYW